MAVETTFQDLVAKLRALREAVASLQITAVEDRPLSGSVLLVERIGDAADDLRGLAEESLAAADEALKAVGHPLNDYHARNSLASANRQFLQLEYKLLTDEMSAGHLNELTKFGRRHGREWLGWTKSVLQALDQCRKPDQDAGEAFLLCWQDLAERLGSGGVSVQTTNIGPISAPSNAEKQRANRPRRTGDRDDATARHRNSTQGT
jgi:hypothetical protein